MTSRIHEGKKYKSLKCKDNIIHRIEYCESCVAIVCLDCEDGCDLLALIRENGIKIENPAPNPYGVEYQYGFIDEIRGG